MWGRELNKKTGEVREEDDRGRKSRNVRDGERKEGEGGEKEG